MVRLARVRTKSWRKGVSRPFSSPHMVYFTEAMVHVSSFFSTKSLSTRSDHGDTVDELVRAKGLLRWLRSITELAVRLG